MTNYQKIETLLEKIESSYVTPRKARELTEKLQALSSSFEKPSLTEGVINVNYDKVLDSEIVVAGLGTHSLSSLMTSIRRNIKDFGEPHDASDFRRVASLLRSKVLQTKIETLTKALDELRVLKQQGGMRSKRIPDELIERQVSVLESYKEFKKKK